MNATMKPEGISYSAVALLLAGRVHHYRYWLLLTLSALAFIVASLDQGRSFEHPRILLLLNIIFYLAISVAISGHFAVIFKREGAPCFFFLANGVAMWGLSGLLGVIVAMFPVQSRHFDANALVTVHNSCIWLAAIFHLVAIILSAFVTQKVNSARNLWLLAGYVTVGMLVWGIVQATKTGGLPIFFILDSGGTIVRQFVVGSTTAMFILSALLLRQSAAKQASTPVEWYEIGLWLMALGLLCIWAQTTTGGWLGWYGRGLQYLGGMYMLMAAIKAERDNTWRVSTPFENSEVTNLSYQLLLILAIGIASVLVTAAIHLLILKPTDPKINFLAFLPAVMFAIYLGGTVAGSLSFSLSSILVLFFHHLLEKQCVPPFPADILQFLIFLGVSVGMAVLTSTLRRSRADLIAAIVDKQHTQRHLEDAQSLRDIAGRLENIIEGTRAGTWDWNIVSGSLEINKRWAEMVGHELEDLAPIDITTWQRLVHPEDTIRIDQLLQRVLSGEEPIFDCEFRMRHRDGRWVWVHDRGKVMHWNEERKPLRMTGSHTDITSRKQVEEQLRSLNQEMQAILLSVPFNLAKSVLGDIVWHNLKRHDQEPGSNEREDYKQHLFLPSEHFAEIYHRALPILRQGEIFRTVEEMPWGDSRRCQYRIIGKAIDAENMERGIIWTMEDITERRKIETALIESEKNFRNIVETIADLVVVVSPEGKLLFANSRFLNTLQLSEHDLADIHLLDLHPPQFHEEAKRIFAAMLRNEKGVCPIPIITKNGTIIPVETRAWLGTWSGLQCIFGFIRDLSPDQEEKQRFEALFRHNPTVMAITSHPRHTFAEVNDAFVEILGYERSEVLGKTADELGLFLEPENQHESLAQLLLQRRIRNHEHQVRHKDGTILHGLFSGEVINTQGREYHVTVMVDLTKRVLIEKELFQAKEQAELADAEKSRLLSIIAHEFRTPLALLNSSLDILERYRERLTLGDIRLQEQHIRSALAQLKSLIDASQAYNWLESDHREPQRNTILLEDFIRQVARDAEIAWADGHRLSIVISSQAPIIESDEILLRSILINLLANAFQYSPADSRVVLSATSDLTTLQICVEDNGIGIPPQELARVFDPFIRGSNASGKRGMGLGLNIVKLSLEKLRATIEMTSEHGRGTKVQLVFPHPIHLPPCESGSLEDFHE